MTLSASDLGDELKALGLYANEADAVNAWASAFSTYFSGAQSNAAPILIAVIPGAKAAMIAAMTGFKTDAATALQTGITAFWGVLAATPSAAWATVTAIAPPTLLSGIGAALSAVFASNKASGASKDAAMEAIANSIHSKNQGGTATWPTPILTQSIT